MGIKEFCQKPDILKIAYMVAQGAAIVLHIVALAAPKWDNFKPHMKYPGQEIDIHQNIWTVVDKSAAVYSQRHSLVPLSIDEEWKKPIVLLMTTAMSVAVVANILLVMTATLKKFTEKQFVHVALLIAVFLFNVTSATEVIYAALEFETHHRRILSTEAYKPYNMVPYHKFGMDSGYYICLSSGGMYALGASIIISDLIKIVVLKLLQKGKKVSPAEDVKA